MHLYYKQLPRQKCFASPSEKECTLKEEEFAPFRAEPFSEVGDVQRDFDHVSKNKQTKNLESFINELQYTAQDCF